jgi:hypothetical protein
MVSEKIQQWKAQIVDQLQDQQWYQEGRTKWEELDPQSRTYLKFGGAGALAVAAMFLVFSAYLSVRSIRTELTDKNDLINVIQSANDEMRRLKESTPGASQGGRPGEDDKAPWPQYLESTAGSAGIDKASLTISNEKAGATTDMAKETLMDITVKHVNIKQVVRYAFSLENGARPVKLRNLSIDTKNDPSGWIDASLSISGFTLKE